MNFGSHDDSNSFKDSHDQPFPVPPLPLSPFSAYTTEALINQEHLKSLIEGLTAIDGSWTYAISSHPSHDDDSGPALLTWFDGHYINHHQRYQQEDIVTDTEWFFLVSTTRSFSTNALLLPARPFFSGAEQHLSREWCARGPDREKISGSRLWFSCRS